MPKPNLAKLTNKQVKHKPNPKLAKLKNVHVKRMNKLRLHKADYYVTICLNAKRRKK